MKKLSTLLLLTALFLTACGQTPETTPTGGDDLGLEDGETGRPVPTEYNMAEVEKHNTKETCWSVIDGQIYDLTEWMPKHPGGEGNIMKICGKDGTSAFTGQHGGNAKAEGQLDKYYMGMLIQ